MSKNLTRKGIAFGALVALAGSVFAGTPANADANGPITLLPSAGTTFNSIIGAGITLSSALDPRLDVAVSGATDNNNLLFAVDFAKYVISNPSGAVIKIDVNDSTPISYQLFDADGKAFGYTNASNQDTADVKTDKTANVTANIAVADGDYNLKTADENAALLTAEPFVNLSDGASAVEYVTNASKIVIAAAVGTVVADGDTNSEATISNVKLDTTSTSAVSLSVQTITDSVTSSATLELGRPNSFENASKTEAVTLLPVSAVSATTTITKLARSASYTAGTTNQFLAKVVFNNDINPHQVAAKTFVSLFKDGSIVTLNSHATTYSADNDVIKVGFSAANTLVSTVAYNKSAATTGADFGAGIYTAQAYFQPASDYIAVGAASPVVDLSNGQNATVDAVDGYLTADKNTAFASDVATVRTGTKATTLVAQIQASSASLEASNVQVRATVTATKLGATSATTVSGAATGLAKTDDSVVAYGRTDSKGLVNFAISNAGAVAGDKLTAVIGVLKSNGTWTAAETVTITWAAADLKTFEAKPGAYVSGANPTVTFLTKDQFGEAIDVDSDASLSVTAVASVAGVEKPATFSKTVAVSAGKVVFTFANFAAAGSSAQLVASLKAGASAATPSTGSASITVNVYNSLGTDKIAVVDSFEKAITYKDFVTGDSTDTAVAAKLLKVNYAAGDYQTITGTVTNVNGSGQPGIAVEVSGAGLLFKADTTYATDKITAYANEYGVFTVDVFSHVVNVKGIKVSFSADGKTASTLLKTKLPTSITDANLAFSWKLPALLVKNTTYAVTAKLADKWGNPVAAADSASSAYAVRFQGTGSVEVNSSSAAIDKDFDKNGSVTVFVRSVKDIAGPGSVSATLGTGWGYPTELIGTKSNAGTIDAYETVDDTATAWDETAWSNELSSNLEIFDKAPTATVSAGAKKANVVVKNASGATVTVVSGTKSVTKVATSNTYSVSLTKLTAGKKTVKVYVNDVLVSSKSVTVKK